MGQTQRPDTPVHRSIRKTRAAPPKATPATRETTSRSCCGMEHLHLPGAHASPDDDPAAAFRSRGGAPLVDVRSVPGHVEEADLPGAGVTDGVHGGGGGHEDLKMADAVGGEDVDGATLEVEATEVEDELAGGDPIGRAQ